MLSPKFKAKNINGKLKLEDKDKFDLFLSTLPEDVYLTFVEKNEQRSKNQNSYYWPVVVGLISETTGYTPKEVHEYLKKELLPDLFPEKCKPVLIGKKEIMYEPSTKDLTKKEFELFTAHVRQWASQELSCYIPLPNEVRL